MKKQLIKIGFLISFSFCSWKMLKAFFIVENRSVRDSKGFPFVCRGVLGGRLKQSPPLKIDINFIKKIRINQNKMTLDKNNK
jgi:hypothetical protein